MAENVTRVTLAQLADLSLNCPDLGTLNFSILHILLQVLIKQVQRDDLTVEFRGREAEKIASLMKAAVPGPPSTFSEYSVAGGGSGPKKSRSKEKRTSLTELHAGKKESGASSTVIVVEPAGGAQFHKTLSIDKVVFDQMRDDIEKLKSHIANLEDLPGNLELINALRKDTENKPILEMFQMLTLKKRMDANEAGVEKVVTLLEDVVKAASQGNMGQDRGGASKLLEQARVLRKSINEETGGPGGVGGIAGRKHSAVGSFGSNIGSDGSKITAAGSLADAAAAGGYGGGGYGGGYGGGGGGGGTVQMLTPEAIEHVMNLELRVAELEEALQIMSEGGMPSMNFSKKDTSRPSWASESRKQQYGGKEGGGADYDGGADYGGRDDGGKVDGGKDYDGKDYGDDPDYRRPSGGGNRYEEDEYEYDEEGNRKKKCAKTMGPAQQPSLLEGTDLTAMSENEAMTLIQAEIQRITGVLQGFDLLSIMRDINMLKNIRLDGPSAPPDVKITRMETKFSETVDQVHNLNTTYSQQISQVRQQIVDVQHEVTDALARVNSLLPGGDSSGLGDQGIIDLYNKFMQLQDEMNVVAETANKLIEEKDSIQTNMEAMLEQIDLLKLVKANREDLEEALGDKADACAVNRKVSHDQFDQACDDLGRGLEEALEKLTLQEEMWMQALEDIQKEIGNKLDKMEVEPLRDFVNDKLKGLQDKFKKLTHLKQETEAAGTRNKLLRNVNCISCDKDVVMRREMDPALKPKQFALPAARNMAPYLAYELDQLRKQQKCIPGGKNLHHFENAVKGSKGQKDKDHICNRYCGGSHTVTTPQQRVTRMGHFLEQYGPDVAPMGGDEFVKGNDNKMYHARDPPSERQSKSSRAGAGTDKKVSSARSLPGDNVVTRDASTTLPVSNKEAEDILAKEAGENPRPKASIDVLPVKLSVNTSPEEGRASVAGSVRPSVTGSVRQSVTGSVRPSVTGSVKATGGGSSTRGSLASQTVQEKASPKNVSVGPEEGNEG